MKPDKILYTAHATSTGGREGTSKSDDGVLDLKLSTPKGLGGGGGPGTNPEQLFAAGYSACFIGAMKHVAMMQKVTLPADTSITADVGIGPIPQGFGIQVALHVTVPGMARDEARKIVDAAHQGRTRTRPAATSRSRSTSSDVATTAPRRGGAPRATEESAPRAPAPA